MCVPASSRPMETCSDAGFKFLNLLKNNNDLPQLQKKTQHTLILLIYFSAVENGVL